MQLDIQNLRSQLINYCYLLESYGCVCDEESVKKYNSCYDKINDLYIKYFKQDVLLAYNTLFPLLQHECITVKIKAAVFCLRLNIAINESLEHV